MILLNTILIPFKLSILDINICIYIYSINIYYYCVSIGHITTLSSHNINSPYIFFVFSFEMPTKERQRREYKKERKAGTQTPSIGHSSPNFVSNMDNSQESNSQTGLQDQNFQNNSMDETVSLPSSSKRKGRPKKTPRGMHNTSSSTIKNQSYISTPRTTRLKRRTSMSPPLPKKGKSSESLSIQNFATTNQINFEELQTIQFAQQKFPNATICKRAAMPLFNDDGHVLEIQWGDLNKWLNEQLIFPFLCLLAKKADRPTIVVDSLATDSRQNINRNSRTIRRMSFIPNENLQTEVILMPIFFPGHWALVIHDQASGTYFADSLATNPHRLGDPSRIYLIKNVLSEYFPNLIDHDIVFQTPKFVSQQPDGNSCGYYTCLFAEAWLFNNQNLNLAPMNLIAEKKRILWHLNELYSTDEVNFRSRYATSLSIPIETLSITEDESMHSIRSSSPSLASVMSIDSVISDSTTSSKKGGRPRKNKRSAGRSKKGSIPKTNNLATTRSPTPRPALMKSTDQKPKIPTDELNSDSLDIPHGPILNPLKRIATYELLTSRELLQELWSNPNEWLIEDAIFSFQRYIASITTEKHVMVLNPLYSSLDIHYGPGAMEFNPVENCYNYSPNYDVLLFTICFPAHFCLIIFDRSDRNNPKCLFVDPLPEWDRLYSSLYPLYDVRRLQLIANVICQLTPGLLPEHFIIRPLPLTEYTQQPDRINCGFLVCLYSESYLFQNTSLMLPNLNINYQRKRILWHLAQLFVTNEVPYIPLFSPAPHLNDSIELSEQSDSDSVFGPDVILTTIDSSDTDSCASSIPVRRSPRLQRKLSSLSSYSNNSHFSSSSNDSNSKQNAKLSPITQRCYKKHHGLPCADVRAKHTTVYRDTGNLGDKECDYCHALFFASEPDKKKGKISSGKCCNHGKVVLPPFKEHPDDLKELLKGGTQESKEFLDLENCYNTLLAFASISVGHCDSHLDTGVCFLLNGEFQRSVSSMFPGGKFAPSFSQLYILDPSAAQEQREQNFKYGGDRVDKETLKKLDTLLRKNHPLAKKLMNFHRQYQRELAENGPDAVANYRFTILEARDAPDSIRDPTIHPNLTTLPDEGGALFAIWTETEYPPALKGVWITNDEGKLNKLPPYHPLTDTLCYPLLFPHGDDGFHPKIPLKIDNKANAIDDKASSKGDESEEELDDEESIYSVSESDRQSCSSETPIHCSRQYLSKRQYIRFRMALRKNEPIHHIWSAGGGLSQKFTLDYAARIDADVANYLRKPELDLRSSLPENVLKWLAKNAGVNSTDDLGSVVTFRKCHPGTRPYMQAKYYDATHIMARIKKPGYACFMFTFTTNPRWPEIKRNFLHQYQKVPDRPDLVCRIFEDKMQYVNSLMKRNLFGKIHAQTSREYQKKYGGPHIHSIFQSDILDIPENIENLIWAHIPPAPDVNDHSEWANFIRRVRELIPKYQIHDCDNRCRRPNRKICKKGFPKPFSNFTILHDDRPAVYYRPSPEDGGEILTVKKGKKTFTYNNSQVSAFNPYILVLTETHHNLEHAYGRNTNFKYLFKYPFKSVSFVYVKSMLHQGKVNIDEPAYYSKEYYRAATEAYDRIVGHKYAELSHIVMRLSIHLPGKQKVYIKPGQAQDTAQQIQAGNLPETALTAYWKQWATDPEMKNILFENMPEKYSLQKNKTWKKRVFSKRPDNIKNRKPIVGRIWPVSPHDPELFALYLLTKHFPGDPDYLKTVNVNGNDHVCATFLEAARLRGLLEDDQIWIRTLEEASNSFMPNQMRQLLANILVFGSTQSCIVDGAALWQRFLPHFYDSRCTDAQKPARIDKALSKLERLLITNGKLLSDFGLPNPSNSVVNNPALGLNLFFFPQQTNANDDDDDGDDNAVDTDCFDNAQLNPEQQNFHDLINSSFDDPLQHRLFHLKGDGGTGKTFLLNYILYKLRETGKKIIPTASTGMASTRFYSGGTTVHSAFRMGIHNEPGKLPSIAFDSFFGRLIIESDVIMIDEMTALNRVVFENVDLLCQQLCRCSRPFGGKIVIITGDWKQQLTVVEDSYGTNAQVAACIQSSHLYPHFRPFQLTQNMRLLPNQQAFQKWLDEIGKGLTGDNVPIPHDMLVHSRDELIQWVFDQGYNLPSNEMLKRLLLAVTNINVDLNNTIVLREMNNPVKHYYSVDRALEDDPFAVNAADYDVTHLNQMNPIGMPAHDIEISVGATIVLLSNLNTARGLCNGTRLIVKNLKNDLIEAEAITGGGLGGTIIGIPRVRSTHAAKHPHDVPFERFQFPVRVAFAMTINKAQGQTCERLGIDFTDDPFAHGQLYTSVSRCTSKEGIKIFAPNKKLDDQGRPLIRNVVARGLDLN